MRFSIVLAHLLKVAKFQPIVDKVQNLGSVFFLDVFLDTEGRPQVKHLFFKVEGSLFSIISGNLVASSI